MVLSSYQGASAMAGLVQYRVAIHVTDSYVRGKNNFQAPGYDYTFKTLMINAPPPGHRYYKEHSGDGGQGPDSADGSSGASGDTSMKTLGLALGIFFGIVFLVVACVMFVRLQRRRRRKLYAVDRATVEWRKRYEQGTLPEGSRPDDDEFWAMSTSVSGHRVNPRPSEDDQDYIFDNFVPSAADALSPQRRFGAEGEGDVLEERDQSLSSLAQRTASHEMTYF
jgi:hypothetical protein